MTDTECRRYDLDDDAGYVEALYRILLERDADTDGRDYYASELREGRLSRRDVLNQLLTSPEGKAKTRFKYEPQPVIELAEMMREFIEVFPNAPFLHHVSAQPVMHPQLCECGEPRKWLEPEWRATLEELGLSSGLELMHRKGFEWTQTIYGLRALDMLRDDARCLGVGSGHEAILYWLANHVGHVTATDLYEGNWAVDGALEGDPQVLVDPSRYAPFEYREDRLRFLQMDGRDLEFPDDSFDIVFSLGSIEHFGGNEAAARAMREKARVCRPDGVAVVATELILNDRQHDEFFTIDELHDHIVAASGMKLIQPPVFEIPSFALHNPCVMPEEAQRTPHLILDFDGVVTTSVILFFRHR